MTSRIIKTNRTKAKLNSENLIVIVNRSNKNISAQIIDPITGKTYFGATSNKLAESKSNKAINIGKQIATKLKELKIDKVQFNRNGYLYHGRVKTLADSIREDGITI